MPTKEKKGSVKVMSKSEPKEDAKSVMVVEKPTTPAPTPYSKYDEAAEYDYYDKALREALKSKNPQKFSQVTRDIQAMRSLGNVGQWDVQKAIPKDYTESLNDAEIKAILSKLKPISGQDPYQRFQQLRRSVNLAGKDYGWAERLNFTDYSPRDLAAEKVTSLGTDSGYFYRPTIQNGVLVRNTNIPDALMAMRK